jgi:hypothetical protein
MVSRAQRPARQRIAQTSRIDPRMATHMPGGARVAPLLTAHTHRASAGHMEYG